MKASLPIILAMLLVVTGRSATSAETGVATLRPNTIAAFDRYVLLTELRLDEEARGTVPFLWVDRLPETRRGEAYARLQHGETVVNRLETRDAGSAIEFPHGRCHHWVGTIFAPGARLSRTVSLMQGYEGYRDLYGPAVRRSITLSREGNRFRVYMQLFMKKVVSVVLNTEYDVQYLNVAPTQMHVRSYSTRIAEVRNADTSEEGEKPIGRDSGFLWRFNNCCALEERDGGTYVQCESVSLSRSIPVGLGWLIEPFVASIPRESLEFTLEALRAALTMGR